MAGEDPFGGSDPPGSVVSTRRLAFAAAFLLVAGTLAWIFDPGSLNSWIAAGGAGLAVVQLLRSNSTSGPTAPRSEEPVASTEDPDVPAAITPQRPWATPLVLLLIIIVAFAAQRLFG